MKIAFASVLPLALAVSLAADPAPAAAARVGVAVSQAWSRPVAAGLSTGVVYLTLKNTGTSPDRLIGASSPVAARATLHRSSMQHGMMSMTPVAGGLELPSGAIVRLQPDGYHLMLNGLKTGLSAWRRFPLTLRFARAAPLTVQVEVRDVSDGMAEMAMH